VPVSGSAAELPSSHSTHCWKCAPLLVEEYSESLHTTLSALVASPSTWHCARQGELGVTWRPRLLGAEDSRMADTKTKVLRLAIIVVAGHRIGAGCECAGQGS
jgi:hypothetical protein